MKSSLPPPPQLDVEHAMWSNLDLDLKMPSNDVATENSHSRLFDALRLGDNLCAAAGRESPRTSEKKTERSVVRWRQGRWKRRR